MHISSPPLFPPFPFHPFHLTCDHFGQHTTQCPPIHREPMRTLERLAHQLRGHVHHRPAAVLQRSDIHAVYYHLCKSKVAQTHVTFSVDQHVLWLEVSVRKEYKEQNIKE